MTFLEAKRLLQEQGYTVAKAPDRRIGVTEYEVRRLYKDPETNRLDLKRWLLTAEDIKGGVFHAQTLAEGNDGPQ